MVDRNPQMRLSKCLKTKLQHARDTTRLNEDVRAKAKEDRERYYNNLADEVEEGLLHNIFVQPMQLYTE